MSEGNMEQAFKIVLDQLLQAKVETERDRVEIFDLREKLAREREVPGPRHIMANDVLDMLKSMAGSRKIEAIKALRDMTGLGLKESKDAIEAAMGPHLAA